MLIFHIDEINSLNVAVLLIKASVDVISGPMCWLMIDIINAMWNHFTKVWQNSVSWKKNITKQDNYACIHSYTFNLVITLKTDITSASYTVNAENLLVLFHFVHKNELIDILIFIFLIHFCDYNILWKPSLSLLVSSLYYISRVGQFSCQKDL